MLEPEEISTFCHPHSPYSEGDRLLCRYLADAVMMFAYSTHSYASIELSSPKITEEVCRVRCSTIDLQVKNVPRRSSGCRHLPEISLEGKGDNVSEY